MVFIDNITFAPFANGIDIQFRAGRALQVTCNAEHACFGIAGAGGEPANTTGAPASNSIALA